jgi:signal transduction histidine kinase
MNLSKKTLLYSSIISIIIVSLIVGYFILMLPSLYVAYMQDRNYDSIVELQKGYMKTGSYENLDVKNPTGTITVEIPTSGNTIYAVNSFMKITIDVKSEKMQDMLEKLRYYANHKDELKDISEDDFDIAELKDELLKNNELSADYPLKFTFELHKNENMFEQLSSKTHLLTDDLMVFESNVTDGHNYYTSYIAVGLTKHTIDISLLSIMTPRIDEIRPVVFQSLPLIVAVALLLVLVSSQVFSRLIILPIIKLANHAEFMKEAKNIKLEAIPISGHDEISSLGESLNGLYKKIQENYQELEVKNNNLAEENQRQEVFLRASSHQLKTPITAALLLVQGMIGEVGKYKDVKEYLPQVKQQLLSMQKIVEDILYLNHCSRNLEIEPISLTELTQECLSSYQVQIEEKALTMKAEGQAAPQLMTDRELLRKIIDNLLSNAIYFTPEGGSITITYEEKRLCIINYGVSIDEELLPHVFDPFVTSVNRNKAHGLGLYVVSYYAKFLHCQVKLQNIDNGVMAELIFLGDSFSDTK